MRERQRLTTNQEAKAVENALLRNFLEKLGIGLEGLKYINTKPELKRLLVLDVCKYWNVIQREGEGAIDSVLVSARDSVVRIMNEFSPATGKDARGEFFQQVSYSGILDAKKAARESSENPTA